MEIVSTVAAVIVFVSFIWFYIRSESFDSIRLEHLVRSEYEGPEYERVPAKDGGPSTIAKSKSARSSTALGPEAPAPKPSRTFQLASAFLNEDSREGFLSVLRDLVHDAREMRADGESEAIIRGRIRRQTILAYLAFATAPIARALRAPFRWRRD